MKAGLKIQWHEGWGLCGVEVYKEWSYPFHSNLLFSSPPFLFFYFFLFLKWLWLQKKATLALRTSANKTPPRYTTKSMAVDPNGFFLWWVKCPYWYTKGSFAHWLTFCRLGLSAPCQAWDFQVQAVYVQSRVFKCLFNPRSFFFHYH